jgi:hypothetical protein
MIHGKIMQITNRRRYGSGRVRPSKGVPDRSAGQDAAGVSVMSENERFVRNEKQLNRECVALAYPIPTWENTGRAA